MPAPSSATEMSEMPPPAISTSTRVAPASIAFSRSSLTALEGRSTTSPAAIWLARLGDITAMRGSVRLRSVRRDRVHGDAALLLVLPLVGNLSGHEREQ